MLLLKHTVLYHKSSQVPGKSSQECFDRVNGSLDTPPQPQPRSRANRSNLSPVANFSLPGSKHIEHPIPPGKKLGSRKKNLVTQKTVRHLLKKHCVNDRNHEADYFSILETSPTALSVDIPKTISPVSPGSLSSPSFLRKCSGGRLSAHQKVLSRVKSLSQASNPSPEVLKRIKNVALHEKYIDQLHNRDARRKYTAARAGKNEGALKIVGLTAARTALMSEAREFISHFQHMQANCQGDGDTEEDKEEEEE